jgi:biotin carboxyl carrier protein
LEHTLTATHEGVVEALKCAAGDLVEGGVELAVIGKAAEAAAGGRAGAV